MEKADESTVAEIRKWKIWFRTSANLSLGLRGRAVGNYRDPATGTNPREKSCALRMLS